MGDNLLVAIKPFQLHLNFGVFLKGHLFQLSCNEVQVRPQCPLHIFLAFLKSFLPYLPCNGVAKRPQIPLHQICRKAFEQVIWLRTPHLVEDILRKINWSLSRLRM